MAGDVTRLAVARLERLPSAVTLIRAPNAGPMTLDGTNTWVLRSPVGAGSLVVDPGPDDPEHLARVALAAATDGPVTVVITHSHPDHDEGLEEFLRQCPGSRTWRPGAGGDSPELFGVRVEAFATPGHTADSISLRITTDDGQFVFSGDTILGRGTTVIAHPDGDLGDYLDSLRLLGECGAVPVLPGHGPALTDCALASAVYLEHRLDRLAQVRAAWRGGTRAAAEIVAEVYAEVDRSLWWAAEMSVRAQLDYLERVDPS